MAVYNFKDEIGNRYGKCVVINQTRINRQGTAMWECLCDCGNKIIVSGANLRSGHTRSCGCLRNIDETGNKYGKLLVICRSKFHKKKPGSAWLCKCDCGNTRIVSGGELRYGQATTCGCSRKRLDDETLATKSLWSDYKTGAKRKGIKFCLSKQEIGLLIRSNCLYCGAPPNNILTLKYRSLTFKYMGIDRKNNNLGYTMKNVVPCCAICNFAKRDIAYKKFISWIENLVLFHNSANLGNVVKHEKN